MIGRTNAGGGGGGLNFKVVCGSAQPGNPKENTIWVNTDRPITSWAFSTDAPGSPVEGMVWISTGTESNVEFNALKKDCVMVYPSSAKQYISGAWEVKDAKSFQGGSWKDWWVWDGSTLYSSGDECTIITGGWTSYAYSINDTYAGKIVDGLANDGSTLNITFASDTGKKSTLVAPVNTIDLTDYKTLEVKIAEATGLSQTGGPIIMPCVFDSAGSKIVEGVYLSSAGTKTADISALNGKYRPGIMIWASGSNKTATAKIEHIKLT